MNSVKAIAMRTVFRLASRKCLKASDEELIEMIDNAKNMQATPDSSNEEIIANEVVLCIAETIATQRGILVDTPIDRTFH